MLVDNGGEFANSEFTEMYDYHGINIKTTAAESPRSDGMVESNNQSNVNMMNKTICDTQSLLELGLRYVISAKNSIHSKLLTFQLVLGRNSKFLSTLTHNLRALSIKPSSEVLQET